MVSKLTHSPFYSQTRAMALPHYRALILQSRGQQLCKAIGTKESVNMRKDFKPTGLVWYTNMAAVLLFMVHPQYGRRFIVFGTQMVLFIMLYKVTALTSESSYHYFPDCVAVCSSVSGQ